ncbi:MAG: metallophosphoesterase [Opitutales bacterium]|nr:metallophosphoesterase [Opitutales bacterium]
MPERIIAIGDVHGCALELERLLIQLSPRAGDRIVMLGDLVNRGPDSSRVIEICREIGAMALMGNHERRLLRARSGSRWRKLDDVDMRTYSSLSPADWAYIEKMQLTIYARSFDTVFVHGGFAPGRPWSEQKARDVTRIQVVDKQGRGMKRSEAPAGCRHWSELWKGPPFVIYGHSPWSDVRKTEWTMGLDTGCVYGGLLSAVILPERRIVQVKALRPYYQTPQMWR